VIQKQSYMIISLMIIAAASGCSKLTTNYGPSSGRTGRTSLNGFGALRKTYQNAGFECRNATRLTDRVKRSDLILWTPQLLGQIETRATKWFDSWLRTGDKTLIYIVPDSGSEADYWSDTGKLAPPKQRLAYRKKSATAINQQMTWRLNRTSVQDSGWFDVQPSASRQAVGDLSGEWADEIRSSSEDGSSVMIELIIDESSEADPNATIGVNPFTGFVPTGPGLPTFPAFFEAEASQESVSLRPKLVSESKQTIVAEITSEEWSGSKVIVVAGGSLLTNYAFSRAWNRDFADKLVAASKTSREEMKAVFVTSRWSSVPVRDSKPGIPKATGMELLTVWPINLVTMHGVMLAMIIALAVLPIFGRPRRLRVNRQRDFGDHLDAVAALMNKTNGEDYARSRIREYRKRILGEP